MDNSGKLPATLSPKFWDNGIKEFFKIIDNFIFLNQSKKVMTDTFEVVQATEEVSYRLSLNFK